MLCTKALYDFLCHTILMVNNIDFHFFSSAPRSASQPACFLCTSKLTSFLIHLCHVQKTFLAHFTNKLNELWAKSSVEGLRSFRWQDQRVILPFTSLGGHCCGSENLTRLCALQSTASLSFFHQKLYNVPISHSFMMFESLLYSQYIEGWRIHSMASCKKNQIWKTCLKSYSRSSDELFKFKY